MYEVELNQREEGVSASVKDIMHAAYLGSWISVYKACDAFRPELFPLFQSLWERDSLEKQVVSNVYVKFKTKVDTEWKIAETENLSFHQLLTRLAHPPPESYSAALKYQKKLSSYQFQENRKKIIQNNDFLPLQAALQENEAGPISHAWMTVYPNSEGEDTHYSRPDFLNAEEYCFTYRHRFDITDPTLSSLSSQGTVTCKACSNPVMSSLHLSDCVKFNQGMNDRHHHFVKQLLQISKFAQFNVLPDGHFPPIDHHNKKPDLTLKHWQGGRHLCLDATVISAQGRNATSTFQGMTTGTSNQQNPRNPLEIPHMARI